MTIEEEASIILLNECSQCKKLAGCEIKEAGERPGLADYGLPEEWADGTCAEVDWVDTQSGELFL